MHIFLFNQLHVFGVTFTFYFIDILFSNVTNEVIDALRIKLYIVGVIIFIESSITALVAGTVAKPLCDKNGVSREKLAYICDSTSAPICSLIPLNAWGALLLGLIVTAIDTQVISGDGISLLIASIPFNFYSLFTLAIVLAVIFLNINIGPMKHSTPVPYTMSHDEAEVKASPYKMLLPILVMVLMVPVVLYITGDGDIFKGSGSTSVYYAVIVTLFFMYLYFVPTKTLEISQLLQIIYRL